MRGIGCYKCYTKGRFKVFVTAFITKTGKRLNAANIAVSLRLKNEM